MDIIAIVLGVLGLLTTWRFAVCFVLFGSAAIWLLYSLDRPSNVVSFIAMLVLGVVLGALWQRRLEKRVHAR